MDIEKHMGQEGGEAEQSKDALMAFLLGQVEGLEERELEPLAEEEEAQLTRFEETLQSQLKRTDTFGEAVEKIVMTALVMEYGVELSREKGFGRMVEVISKGVLADHQLRKQALLMINLYCPKKEEGE